MESTRYLGYQSCGTWADFTCVKFDRLYSRTYGQVVLLTDGMDTRPYRLSWPPSTVIFDLSPERVFRSAAEKLAGLCCLTNCHGL